MISQSIPPEMLDYVRQVAQEMRVSEDEAWAIIQNGREGGASTPPPITGQPAVPAPQPPPVPTAAAPAPVSRGRSGQPMPPSQVQQGNGIASMFGMTPEELRDRYDPKGNQTLGGGLLGLFDPERKNLRASEKSPTVGQALGNLAFSAFEAPKSQEETELAEKAMKGYNPLAPMGRQAQLDALAKKKKTLGQGLLGLFG